MVLGSNKSIACRGTAKAKYKEYENVGQQFDLVRIDVEINAALRRSRMLAEELGARYAVFRCEPKKYDDGRHGPSPDILRLSREADRCIAQVLRLEERRRELMEELGR